MILSVRTSYNPLWLQVDSVGGIPALQQMGQPGQPMMFLRPNAAAPDGMQLFSSVRLRSDASAPSYPFNTHEEFPSESSFFGSVLPASTAFHSS